jgi:hypothetical protein
MFDLYALHTTACNSYESGAQCAIAFQDVSPIHIKDCPAGFPEAERSLSVSQQQVPDRCSIQMNGDQLTITAKDAIFGYSIYDVLGRQIATSQYDATADNEIHITMAADQASGYYTLVVETARGNEVHRGFYE